MVQLLLSKSSILLSPENIVILTELRNEVVTWLWWLLWSVEQVLISNELLSSDCLSGVDAIEHAVDLWVGTEVRHKIVLGWAILSGGWLPGEKRLSLDSNAVGCPGKGKHCQ